MKVPKHIFFYKCTFVPIPIFSCRCISIYLYMVAAFLQIYSDAINTLLSLRNSHIFLLLKNLFPIIPYKTNQFVFLSLMLLCNVCSTAYLTQNGIKEKFREQVNVRVCLLSIYRIHPNFPSNFKIMN